MATTYESNLVKRKTRNRGMYEGKNHEVSGRIFLESGTVLSANDILLGVPVGENQAILSVAVLVIGDTSTAAGSVGRFQILDSEGNAATVERNGPFGTAYTSPATDGDLYAAIAQLDGYAISNQATPVKLAGPANVGILVTTGATVGADTEIFISCVIRGETSETEVSGGYSEQEYLLDPVQGTEQ